MPSDAPRYRALLFDVMGTLVREPFFEAVPQALGMSLDELLATKHPSAWVTFEKGLIDEPTFKARFFADGRDYDHEGMKAAMISVYDWLPGTEAIVAELKDRGHALHLLSNYPCWYQLIEDKLKLSRYAPWSFVSCNMGVRKPHPDAYRIPTRTLGARPGELLFIDDRTANCEAARAQGLDAIVFTGAEALREALAARGLLSPGAR